MTVSPTNSSNIEFLIVLIHRVFEQGPELDGLPNLLVSELQNQDPLNATSVTDFINQMTSYANFTAAAVDQHQHEFAREFVLEPRDAQLGQLYRPHRRGEANRPS